MVITDTAQKTTLIGGFGIYNDSTKEALATIYPLLMEYSQGDTLFLRADTIKTFIVTEMVPDKRKKTLSGFPEHEGKPIVMADSTGAIWIDSTFFYVRIPYADTPVAMLIKRMMEDKAKSTKKNTVNSGGPAQITPAETPTPTAPIDSVPLSLSDELMDSVEHATLEAMDILENDSIKIPEIETVDSLIKQALNFKEEPIDSIPNNRITIEGADSISSVNLDPLEEVSPDNLEIDLSDVLDEEPVLKQDSIPYEYHVALAYHRGRFFKQDMQGVADSMVFVEKDSMLYMFRKPIVWSGERQVTGNRIDVHFNDSTVDTAYLPEFGLMSEFVEEDFYNQIFGKEITAYFENQGLRRMEVSGNVETIFLPQEEDSTYNRLVNAESSYMDAYLSENKLERLKMWPEVSGTVTPLFLVKRAQMYLPKFKWWGFLRPEREWYGDRWRWADNLGEVPEELEQYFMTPSDFGEPKSFAGTRFIPPVSSLPAVPDSIETGADSLAVKDVEEHETLGEVEESETQEENVAEETEEEATKIEEMVTKEEEEENE